jgi:WxL domain surface cell wall-binding
MDSQMIHGLETSRLLRRGGVALLAAASILGATASIAGAASAPDQTQFSVTAGALAFSTTPALPALGAVTLNGAAQTTKSTMTPIGVNDASGAAAGWNVTVIGNTAAGKSPVFAQYCLGPAVCGADAASSYVPAGASLPADSLNLNSTGAGFTAGGGSTGTAPTHQCDTGVCPIDAASATKVIAAAAGGGMGTYTTNTYSATSLPLVTPSTLKALPTNEVYRADVVWTLTSGP